jgi:APA family basic amino acid/polyamine antiporter
MVGTGIFTSLGYQVGDLPTGFAILALWVVGGVCALCGALSYAELGAALPRSGGEYHFLGAIYHPAVGFLAGWISATVGFAAPVAIASMAFATYFHGIFPNLPSVPLAPSISLNPELWLALGVAVLTTLPLLRHITLGSAFQNASTLLKIALIVVIIIAGLFVKAPQQVSFLPVKGDGTLITSAPFGVSLYWVMYAYSGWNASTYIVGELRNPGRAIPLSVGLGTLLVMALYISVNAIFLHTTPAAEMAGEKQVALIAGKHIFGVAGANVMAFFISIGLISTVSSMMWIGPRVMVAMGEDLHAFKWLAHRNRYGTPTIATLAQFAVVIILLLTSTFSKVTSYVQFSLTLCSTLAVAGVFVLRWRQPDLPRPYRTWGYPVTPLVFFIISVWMMWQMLATPDSRAPSLWGLATMALGLIVYYISPARTVPADRPTLSQ